MLSRGMWILLIVLLSLFGPLSTDMYLAGLPEMVVYFDTSESVMNMTLYMFMLALAVGVLLLGPVSDKYGRRKVLLASMVLYTVASIACCLAPNVWVLIGLRVVQAIGGAGAMCISVALIKDVFEGREMGRMLTITSALAIVGPILAPILGNLLITYINWQATFWAPAIVSLLCLALSLGVPASLPEERLTGPLSGIFKEIGDVVRDRSFSVFAIMMTAFACAQLAYISVSSYVFQDTFGLTSTEYSLALAGTLVGSIVLMVVLQRFVPKLKTDTVLAILLALGIVSLVVMLFLSPLHWAVFMVSMIPCAGAAMLARSYGFGILMSQRQDGGGAVSSVLNFAFFAFCCVGMIVASLPWESYITGIAVTILISCVVFGAMWALFRHGCDGLTGICR